MRPGQCQTAWSKQHGLDGTIRLWEVAAEGAVHLQSAKDFEKMGGLGSGKRKNRARKTVESYFMLDVGQLSDKGCLRPGSSSTCQWIDGNEVASINLRAESNRLHLSYPVRVGDREWRDVTDTITIVQLPCRFGGSRAYFICPGPRGTDCGRRITKLQLSHRYLLCRHCNQLSYACQYENSWERALRRANKLKQRLDMGPGLAEALPEKPKGMWARTYGRLLNEILQAEILANEAQVNRLQRLLAQVGNDL
jgi:hypothetical protein